MIPHPRSTGELQRLLAQERKRKPFLVYRDGEGELALASLEREASRLTIGRLHANDIAVDWDNEVSRAHAAVEFVGGEWALVDEGLSRNGTYVNGKRVSLRRRLRDGDAIRVGRTVFLFRAPTETMSEGTVGSVQMPALEWLSPTQRRVLVALCRPYNTGSGIAAPASNRDLADELFMSVDAIKNHLRILFQRFELSHLPQNHKRARLVECAFLWGLVSEREL